MSEETDQEIAQLRARLEALEKVQGAARKPANPSSHLPSNHQPKVPATGRAGSGTSNGVHFGLVAAGLALVVVLAIAVQTAPPRSAANQQAASIDPSKYTALCAVALTRVQFATHQLEGAELTPNDPAVIQAGPPVRLQCGISEGTYIGAVTFDALCDDWQRQSCVNVMAAVMDGRVVYVSPTARAALEAAVAKGHRHHHH